MINKIKTTTEAASEILNFVRREKASTPIRSSTRRVAEIASRTFQQTQFPHSMRNK